MSFDIQNDMSITLFVCFCFFKTIIFRSELLFSYEVAKKYFPGLGVHFPIFSWSRPKARAGRDISSSGDDLHNDVIASVVFVCYFEWFFVHKFSGLLPLAPNRILFCEICNISLCVFVSGKTSAGQGHPDAQGS